MVGKENGYSLNVTLTRAVPSSPSKLCVKEVQSRLHKTAERVCQLQKQKPTDFISKHDF